MLLCVSLELEQQQRMTRVSVRDRNDPRYRTRTLSRIVIVILSHHLVWILVALSHLWARNQGRLNCKARGWNCAKIAYRLSPC